MTTAITTTTTALAACLSASPAPAEGVGDVLADVARQLLMVSAVGAAVFIAGVGSLLTADWLVRRWRRWRAARHLRARQRTETARELARIDQDAAASVARIGVAFAVAQRRVREAGRSEGRR